MGIALWIVQIMLALVFALAGLIRLIGALELSGALGLVLPAATRILPWLTAIAALGLMLTMIGAIIVHLRLQEIRRVVVPCILLVFSLFLVVGSFLFRPFA